MAKSQKHKKQRKQIVSKVKQKIGKKLKKPENETKTDFKTKKVVIKEQLAKQDTDESVKFVKSIPQVIKGLQSHKLSHREESLKQLLSQIQKKELNVILPHLSSIVLNLVKCFFDGEATIRETSGTLLTTLLPKVGSNIEPYFDTIVSHLVCAMVHLNEEIQCASLLLMGILINNCGSLIAQQANKILPSFKSLLSSNPETLEINPDKLISTLKWRLVLLEMFAKYIQVILNESKCAETYVPSSMWQIITQSSFPCYTGRSHNNGIELLDNEEEAKKFFKSLLPLLFQVWVEASPKKYNYEEMQSLTTTEFKTLHVIMDLLLGIWEMVRATTGYDPKECSWLESVLQNPFVTYILPGFPYTGHIMHKKKLKGNNKSQKNQGKLQKNKDKSQEFLETSQNIQENCQETTDEQDKVVYCDAINLSIIKLVIQMNRRKLPMDKGVYFVTGLLTNESKDKTYKMQTVVSTVIYLLQSPKLSHSDSEQTVRALYAFYRRQPSNSFHSLSLIPTLLCLSRNREKYLWSCKCTKAWLQLIAEDLTNEELRQELIEYCIQLRMRNIECFNAALLEREKEITENVLNCRQIESTSQRQKFVQFLFSKQ